MGCRDESVTAANGHVCGKHIHKVCASLEGVGGADRSPRKSVEIVESQSFRREASQASGELMEPHRVRDTAHHRRHRRPHRCTGRAENLRMSHRHGAALPGRCAQTALAFRINFISAVFEHDLSLSRRVLNYTLCIRRHSDATRQCPFSRARNE